MKRDEFKDDMDDFILIEKEGEETNEETQQQQEEEEKEEEEDKTPPPSPPQKLTVPSEKPKTNPVSGKAIDNIMKGMISTPKYSFEELSDILDWIERASQVSYMENLKTIATATQEKPSDAFETLERLIDTADRLKRLSESNINISDTLLSAAASIISNPAAADKLKNILKQIPFPSKNTQ